MKHIFLLLILLITYYPLPNSQFKLDTNKIRYNVYYNICLEQIKEHEGLRLKSYRCANDKLTIGYGHRISSPMTIDSGKALEYLIHDFNRAYYYAKILSSIDTLLLLPISMLIYNIGCGAYERSRLRHYINHRVIHKIQSEWLKWSYINHKKSKRLYEIRKSEINMFNNIILYGNFI